MFDEIVKLVKEHLGNDPQVAAAIPQDKQAAVHQEVASHITNGLAAQSPLQGGVGSLLAKLQSAAGSGSPLVNAIEGGLAGSLASKFGLPPMVTGAIAGALPGLLQKLANKTNDPNDASITPDGLSNALSNVGSGGFGSLFN